ncbi:MAG TPA: hypothetical protein VHF51_00830 [Solirubrobacteraceae bacterium]|nr:hypothetical protein [Solirubrobacteraceae bacterium]
MSSSSEGGLAGGLAAVGGMAVAPTAQAMKGKFDSPLPLASGGRAVLASGPIEWGPGDVDARLFASIRQGGVVAGGTGVFASPADHWRLTLRAAGGRLQPGPAQADAVAATRHADGAYEPYTWSQPVVLV